MRIVVKAEKTNFSTCPSTRYMANIVRTLGLASGGGVIVAPLSTLVLKDDAIMSAMTLVSDNQFNIHTMLVPIRCEIATEFDNGNCVTRAGIIFAYIRHLPPHRILDDNSKSPRSDQDSELARLQIHRVCE